MSLQLIKINGKKKDRNVFGIPTPLLGTSLLYKDVYQTLTLNVNNLFLLVVIGYSL